MEIRDPLHGSIELTPAETAVVDSEFFQRLRNIKQMGFSEFSFPGATHNRYCHSIGAMHLAGQAFDSIFHGYPFKKKEDKWRLRQVLRLGALLHDVGHGPLSHTTEEVMPPVEELQIGIYPKKEKRRANHEDYTIKIITDSPMSPMLRKEFVDMEPKHIVQVIDSSLKEDDDFFKIDGVDVRPLLSQIISSELDADRMDYLQRDSYYCGTSYGKVDSDWLIANMCWHRNGDKLNLALNRRALYTFDDFLISRFHMFMMVYFHHKGVVYDEMLLKYLRSEDCDFFLPADISEYIHFDDYKLHSHMASSKNEWAQLISKRKPLRMLIESHEGDSKEISKIEAQLKNENVQYVRTTSRGRFSKYYSMQDTSREHIYVVESDYTNKTKVQKIEETTEIFKKYSDSRIIDRLYVSRDSKFSF